MVMPGRRVTVVGTSGAGKTTFARELARRLALPCVELDALNWEPGWVEADHAVFRERVAAATAAPAWVVDGNYSRVRDLVWGRADTLVWLDFPRSVVTWRILTRSIVRVARRTELWAGNRERLRQLFGRDSIIWWSVSTYARRRRDYPALIAQHPHLELVRLRSPAAAGRWLHEVSHPDGTAAASSADPPFARKP
jgi:adenylate kinase family enzyme